ncbi:MAG TPA: hypothetical protein VH722_11310 [Alphaproteobacteria bacterium]|jgi:hypothetical protein|nr:hypothetical protein [Alphaproteobacteria bacterium]
MKKLLAACLLFTTAAAQAATTHYGSMATATVGLDTPLNGSIPFPAGEAWNVDISKKPVDSRSAAIIKSIGLDVGLHPDFGAGTYAGAIIGIPYYVVSSKQKPVPIHFTAYGDESDKGPYPIPSNVRIEGYKPSGKSFGGDRHVLVIDKDTNRLYEMDRAFIRPGGGWNCDSGAIFHLDSTNVRPTEKPGWTSADAAGLPIFPGLVRYDEAVTAGIIRHAIRLTVENTRRAYVPPANHYASDDTSPNLPPMGARIRLKASYKIPAKFSPETKAILTALKTYGFMVADNGSSWYLSGAPDNRWNNDHLVGELSQVKGSNFEVVRMIGVVVGK